MICFKVDLLKADELINEFNKCKKNYYDSVTMNYNLLDNVDDSWNDSNSMLFKNKLKDDRFNIFDYYSSLDDLFSKLGNFNDDLKMTLASYGYSSVSKLLLKFDNSQLASIKSRLSNTCYYLNEALYIINACLLKADYKNMNTIYNLRSQINNAINNVNIIKKDIESFCNSIDNIVQKHNNKITKIDGLELNVANVTFEGKLVDLS